MENKPFPSRQTLLTRRQFLKAALVGLGARWRPAIRFSSNAIG